MTVKVLARKSLLVVKAMNRLEDTQFHNKMYLECEIQAGVYSSV